MHSPNMTHPYIHPLKSQISIGTWKIILRSQYRRDCQAINELFISAERKAMLDELIRSIGESLQQKIKNNVVFLDSNGQLE